MSVELKDVLAKYGTPEKHLIGQLPRGGQKLDFVGHADVTKMLIEIDPEWSWEPVAFDADGLPAYRVENGMAHMGGWMTLQGVRRFGIGSCLPNKPDLLKELASDFIRNAAMRFGVCLSLWTKQEWEENSATPKQAKVRAKTIEEVNELNAKTLLSNAQLTQFVEACNKAGIDSEEVATLANVTLLAATVADLEKLRTVYKDMVAKKKAEGEN